jgi:hypothetical protein
LVAANPIERERVAFVRGGSNLTFVKIFTEYSLAVTSVPASKRARAAAAAAVGSVVGASTAIDIASAASSSAASSSLDIVTTWLPVGVSRGKKILHTNMGSARSSLPPPPPPWETLNHTTDSVALEELVQALLQPSTLTTFDMEAFAAHVNTPGPLSSTALIMLCTQGRKSDALQLIRNCGADVNLEGFAFDDTTNKTDKKRRSPLMAAAGAGDVGCVDMLLTMDAAVDQGKSDTGATALSVAAQDGHLDVCRVLLEGGACVDHATGELAHEGVMGDGGTTAMQMVAQGGYVDIARLFLEWGADVDKAATDNGTFFDRFCTRGCYWIACLLAPIQHAFDQ